MTVLLTGTAGFIASHLAERILDRGERVIGIDNLNDFYTPVLKEHNLSLLRNCAGSKNFFFEKGDIRDAVFLKDVVSRYKLGAETTLVHIAAMAGVRPSIQDPSYYVDVNIHGTQNLLELCREAGIKNIVFASSSSVYGDSDIVPFREDMPVDNPISPYAATKKSNELMAHTYHHLYQMNMIGLRFFTVYGARQRPDLAIHKFAKRIWNNEKIPFYGDGTTRRDYTFIDDIIDGVLKSIDYVENNEGIFEILNLGESRTTTLTELVSLLEEKLGKKALLDRLPMQAGDVPQTFADISKAKSLIAYNPQTLINEGLDAFVSWFKNYYKL
jgi:UDP-glucuronate 4-epimerase